MVSSLARAGWLRPWQAAAAVLMAAAMLLTQGGRAEAAIGVTFTLNDTAANANTDATLDITLENDLNPADTIIVTFPAGWVVQDGALTTGGAAIDVSGFTIPPTVAGSAAARTVTFTMGGIQPSIAPITVTFNPTAEIQNAPNGTNVTVLVDTSTGQAQGASAPFTITVAATAATGVTISAAPLTEHTATTITVAFTPSAAGALAATNTVTVTMTGYTLTNGAIVITPTVGFVGGLTGNVTGGNTVTVTLAGGASLAALTPGAFTFPATNPTAGTVAAAGLTVATSQDATTVQSGAAINVTATAVTGVTISAAPLTALAASTITVAFTPTATGALAATNTVTVVMTGYTLANGAIAITPTVGFAGTLSGNVTGGNTVTVTLDGGASLAASTAGAFTFPATNPAAGTVAAGGLTVRTSRNTTDVASSAAITLVGGATAVTGVTISASPLTEAVASTITVAFTPSAAGALAATNTVTVTMTGYTLTNGAIAITTGAGFGGAGALTGNVTGGNTVTVTLGGTRSLAALTPGTFTFPATNPAAGTVAAAGLTVATSQDATVVQSSAAIVIAAVPPPDDPGDPAPGGGGPPMFFPPVSCNAGSYNLGGTCVEASPGHYVALSGATSQTACEPGTYQNNSGMMFCFQVPAGSFTSTTGATSATPWTVCPTGQVEVTAGTATTDRVCGQSPRPKVTALALVPLNASGTLDVNVPFSDWPRADLTGGQTTFTLTVASGRSYGVAAQADSGEITYRRSGISFDPATTRLAAGDTVTVQAANDAGSSPTYTLTLTSSVVCLNGGTPTNDGCVCQPGFSGDQCQTQVGADLASLALAAPASTITFDRATTNYRATVPATATSVRVSLTTVDPSATVQYRYSTVTRGAFSLRPIPADGNLDLPPEIATFFTFEVTSSGGESKEYFVTVIRRGELTGAAITLSSNAPSATGVTVTFSLRTPVVIPANGKIKVTMTGFTWPARPTATFTSPSALANTAAFESNTLTVTLDPGVSIPSDSNVTFTATGATNPAAQAAKTDVRFEVTSSADAVLASTDSGTLPAIAAPATSVTAVTISANPLVAEAPTTITTVARYTTALVAADQITVKLSGYTFNAGAVAVTAGTGITGTLTGTVEAGATDTLVIRGGAVTAGTSATFTFPATHPAAGAIAAGALTIKTSKDTTAVSSTAGFTLRQGTAVTAVTISANPTAAQAPTTITTVARYTTALVAADTITVRLAGYTFNAGAVAVTAGTGITGTLRGSVAAGATDTVVLTGASVAASTSATFTFPATNPAAGSIAASALTLKTSKDPAATASTAGIVITAPALAVTLTAPSTVSASDSFFTATANVTGAGGRTVNYSWLAGGQESLTCETPGTGGADLDVAIVGSGTCTITVEATAGNDSATASAVVTIAAPQPRLEFVTQPQASTTGVADINVQVRAVKADGTADTGFNNQVQFSIQGGGSSWGLGSVTAVNGVATFSRTYNPPRADATWTLRASQVSGLSGPRYAAATSDSFRVTKPKYLEFTTQPVGGTAGAALTTPPQVTFYNADGTVDTSITLTVKLTLKADTANGAVLTSTATAAVAGRATFAGTSVNNAGTGYVLVASATGYADAASEAFDVTGPPTKLAFTQYPGAALMGATLTTDVRVEVRDANDRPVPAPAYAVQLFLKTPDVMLQGTPSSVDGATAVFSSADVRIGGTGSGLILVARASGLTDGESGPITVTGAPAKLAFVRQPGGFGSVLGTQPIVEIQDADGIRVPGATNEVTLRSLATNDTDPILTGGGRRPAYAGRVTYADAGFTGGTVRPGASFTITASATGLTSATSASFGPAGPTTKLAFTSDLPCGLVARPGCSPAAKEGQQFTITVAAQDANGQVNPNESGLATLTSDGNSGMTARTAAFVSGVATFTIVKFTSASTTGYTLTASLGALTVSSGKIVVTPDNTPASLRFIAAPTHEVSGATLITQPVVYVYNAAGQQITGETGNMVIRLRKQGETTTSLLEGPTNVATVNGAARFPGVKVTGADTNLYLSAALEGTILEANQTGTFRVYADAASAATARSSAQTQSKSFSLSINLKQSAAGQLAALALKNDVCTSFRLPAANCPTTITVTTVSSAVMAIDEDGRVLAVANVETVDEQEIVTIGVLDLRAFEAEYGATAPAGTSALYAAARIAVDAYGNRLETLSVPRSFSLPVPESVVLLGTLPGDLKVAWWDDDARRWVQVPTSAVVEPDGSFTVTATTDALGAFAVLYAPGAGRIQTPGVFSADGAGFGVFAGGSVNTLSHAAGLNDATGVWVQDAAGAYRLLVVGGPEFLGDEFASRFPDGIRPSTAVTLVRPAAPAFSDEPSAATASGGTSTYTVTGADTLSGIGAQFGVDWMRIAEANGIAGPNYVVRAGQTLTIPR